MKQRKYFALYAIAGIAIVLLWLLFIKLDFIIDSNQKITFLIASLGFVLSITQFVYNQLRQREDRIFKIQYQEYNKLVSLFNGFSNTLNECLENETDPNNTIYKLMNINNEISVLIKTTDNWIFQKIIKTEESKELSRLTSEIINLTRDFGREYQKIEKNYSRPEDRIPENLVNRMNWQNPVVELLKDVHVEKYKLFAIVQDYMK